MSNGVTTAGTGSASSSDGTFKIDVVSAQVSASTSISGSATSTLTISSNAVGLNRVNCVVSHPTACNSPITSRIANFSVVSPRQIINYEEMLDSSTSLIRSGTANIFDSPLNFFAELQNNKRTIVLYPSERDVRARITLAGSAGLSNGGNRGGYGGVTVFEYTLRRNVEYVIKMGVTVLNDTTSNIGGGTGAFFYEKGKVLICCGGGGGAGSSARGGDGGGAGIAGENGLGTFGGAGGIRVSNGTLPTNGFFPGGDFDIINSSSTTGGRLSGCTAGGSYFATRYAPCDDIGTARFRNSSGTEVPGTALILRGFKPGTAHRNTGGNGSGSNGGGGAGAYGGNAATGSGSGGGGGSGYSDGSTTIISATLGGNTSITSYATIQLA